jgi:hypothetical protein
MTNDNAHAVSIYNSALSNKTSFFTNQTPKYTNGSWKLNIKAKDTAPYGTGYRIGISKAGGSGDLSEELSTTDLGLINGTFQVTNSLLTATYLSITNRVITRADNKSVKFRYRVFYKDMLTQETNDTGYVVTLFDRFDSDVTTNFIITGPIYQSGRWETSFKAKPSVTIATGYYMSIRKNPGIEGETMLPFSSKLMVNGIFKVTNATLSLSNISRTPSQITRVDPIGVIWRFRTFYPDLTTQETIQTG